MKAKPKPNRTVDVAIAAQVAGPWLALVRSGDLPAHTDCGNIPCAVCKAAQCIISASDQDKLEQGTDHHKCIDCGSAENLRSSLSENTLVFGPFRTARGLMPVYVTRCTKCERNLTRRLRRMIK